MKGIGPLSSSRRFWRRWLSALAVAKITVLAVAMLFFHFRPFTGDNAQHYYIPIGHRIAVQGSFNDVNTRDYSSVPPLYAVVMAVFEKVFKSAALPMVVVFQMLCDLFVALILLRLGESLGRVLAGGLAGTAWLIYPPAVVISTWNAPETLFTLALVGGLALLSIPDPASNLTRVALSGLVIGIATLIRGDSLLFPGILIPFWLFKRYYRPILAFMLPFVFLIGIWTVRNYVVLADPIVSSSTFGPAFMQGSDERLYHRDGYLSVIQSAEEAGLKRPVIDTNSNISRWMFQIGLRNYRLRLQNSGPQSLLGMLARKLGYMWFLTESGKVKSQALLLVSALIFLPLGLIELWNWLRSGKNATVMLALAVGFWILIHVLVVPIARYMVPICPVIILATCMRITTMAGGKSEPAAQSSVA